MRIEGMLMLFVTALAIVVSVFGVLQSYDRETAQRITKLESEVEMLKTSCCGEMYYRFGPSRTNQNTPIEGHP